MKNKSSKISLFITAFIVTFLFAINAQAQTWSNGQAATGLIGQFDFNSNLLNEGNPNPTATSLDIPSFALLDSVTGKVFVSDALNRRVLRFASLAVATSGGAAEAVLGQSVFTTAITAAGATGLNVTPSLSLDSLGNLWVADGNSNRILRFANAATTPSGAAANMVIGQTDFNGFNPGLSATQLHNPYYVLIHHNTLWVADNLNNRVLRFDNVNSKPAFGATADGVLGQPDFTSNGTGAASAATMRFPGQLYVDTSGNLWVTDQQFNRVLRYNNAAVKANGANADVVIGQPDFVTGTGNISQSSFSDPFGLAIDATDHLYVSENSNSRILIFNHASTLSNVVNADYVLGQTDFVSSTTGTSATQLFFPFYIFSTGTKLLIADASNHRILVQTPGTLLPLKLINFTGTLQNQNVLLQWQTAEEINTDHFEVEKSIDGKNFTLLTIVKAAGTGNNNYNTADAQPQIGNNYYRLKSVNDDGSFSYSNIVLVQVGNDYDPSFTIYPSPACKLITVSYNNTAYAEISIYTIDGRKVLTASTNGQTKTNIDISNLPTGIYMIEYNSGGKLLRDKFIKAGQ
jgi:hypothetical protein